VEPTRAVLKMLFALSRNICYYPACEQPLADRRWPAVMADVAHIRGEKPGSARYDQTMDDETRRAFENLMLLCPSCHRRIDTLERDEHPVERLEKIKLEHEERSGDARVWTTDEELSRFVVLLEVQTSVMAGGTVDLSGAGAAGAISGSGSLSVAGAVGTAEEHDTAQPIRPATSQPLGQMIYGAAQPESVRAQAGVANAVGTAYDATVDTSDRPQLRHVSDGDGGTTTHEGAVAREVSDSDRGTATDAP
jgi:hypothetical protein